MLFQKLQLYFILFLIGLNFFWGPFRAGLQHAAKLSTSPTKTQKNPRNKVKSDSDHFRHFTFHDEGRKKRQKQNED